MIVWYRTPSPALNRRSENGWSRRNGARPSESPKATKDQFEVNACSNSALSSRYAFAPKKRPSGPRGAASPRC